MRKLFEETIIVPCIREALENTVTAGKIIGRKVRGRSREMLLGDLKLWHGGSSTVQLIWNSGGGGDLRRFLDMYLIWQCTRDDDMIAREE